MIVVYSMNEHAIHIQSVTAFVPIMIVVKFTMSAIRAPGKACMRIGTQPDIIFTMMINDHGDVDDHHSHHDHDKVNSHKKI